MENANGKRFFVVTVKSCLCEEPCGHEHSGRRGNLIAIQIGHAIVTGLPRYASNDIFFIE